VPPEPVVPQLARAADIQALAATLASAMADDPMIRWPMPHATPNEQQALFRAILEPYIELGVAWKLPECSGGGGMASARCGRSIRRDR
jgi:hypothetical protein